MNIRTLLAAGAMLASFAATAADAAFEPFKDGDTVVFFGDSITCGGTYHQLIGDYYRTRFPGRKVRFVNSGLNGDNLTGAQGRIARDVTYFSPTRVLVHFGMNDVGRGNYSDPQTDAQIQGAADCRATFEAKLPETLNLLEAAVSGVKLICATPTVYDDTAVITSDPTANAKNWKGCNAALQSLGAFVKTTAAGRGVPCVDWHKPMNDYLNQHRDAGDTSFMLTGTDRVHPTAAGHAIMAWAFLKAQGVPSVVSDIALNGASGAIVKSENATVTDVTRTADGLTCKVLESALPWPMPESARAIAGDFNAQADFNRETFAVTDLAEGTYALMIDGVDVLHATEAEFAAGIELGANTKTPQYRQAAVMAAASDTLGAKERKARVYANTEANTSAEFREGLLSEQTALYDLVQPVTHTYQVVLANYTRLDYIASTGTQYITTDILPGPKVGVDFRFRTGHDARSGDVNAYFGTEYNNDRYFFGCVSRVFSFRGKSSFGTWIEDQDARLVIDPTASPNNLALTCGVYHVESAVSLAYSGSKKLSLFAASGYGSSFRFYEMSITTNNGVLARHYIPARRNADGVAGLYDTVDDKFYENAGTGEFLAGPTAHVQTLVIAPIADQSFDGTTLPEPSLTVTDKATAATLTAGTDYDVSYFNNNGAGVATACVVGKGDYAGQSEQTTFKITCTAFADDWLTTDDASCRKFLDGGSRAYVFTNIQAAATATLKTACFLEQVLVVGGGGSGGSSMAGGGGGGGVVAVSDVNRALESATTFSLVVGAGGAAPAARTGVGGSGANSTLSVDGLTWTAIGGGRGGGWGTGYGLGGGCGGGGCGGGFAGVGTTGQGFGGAYAVGGINSSAGGGGGAGGEGGFYADGVAGCGGPGLTNSITGVAVCYAGGGGAGGSANAQGLSMYGLGGVGGGGRGARYSDGVAGTDGLGGGGGGSGWLDTSGGMYGGRGGSGTVIIRLSQKGLLIDPIEDQSGGSGAVVEPKPCVTSFATGAQLAEGTHYTLSYANNRGTGPAQVFVTGIGAYAGCSAKASFTITASNFEDDNLMTADGSARRVQNGNNTVYIFTNATLSSAAVTLKRGLILDRALVVGGGGAGGKQAGAGAGGGGALELQNLNRFLAAGTELSTVVGKGGIPLTGSLKTGNNGGDSSFRIGTDVYAAGGGTGGGDSGKAGAASGVVGEFAGNPGGALNASWQTGGGGGAGAPGYSYVKPRNGSGGSGVTNDITGVTTVYGGGGGAGGIYSKGYYYYWPGLGGLGGGGDGEQKAQGHPGIDGLGGGGGGGGRDDSTSLIGGAGGCGTVILSFRELPFVVADIPDQLWTSGTVTPKLTITDRATGEKLVEGVDYTVAYSDNDRPGTATATITFLGDYAGFVIPVKFNVYTRVCVAPDATDAGTGESWSSPMVLSNALAAASAGGRASELWLKEGTYELAAEAENLAYTASLAVRGGFAGTETDPTQRVASARSTIDGGNAYNTLAVTNDVKCPVTLDRLVFRNARSRALQKTGGGDLTLKDCAFVNNGRHNNALTGKGAYLSGLSAALVTLTNCVFEGNMSMVTTTNDPWKAVKGTSGTLYLDACRKAVLQDCVFLTNGTRVMYVSQTTTRTSADNLSGSAIYATATPVLASRCRFAGNVLSFSNKGSGGCVRLEGACDLSSFENCVWTGNDEWFGYQANQTYNGGALSVNLATTAQSVSLRNCTFAYNLTEASNAAGLTVTKGTVTVKDSIFYHNTRCTDSQTYGFDIHADSAAHVSVSHTLFESTGLYNLSGRDAGYLTLDADSVYVQDPLFVSSASAFDELVTGTYRHIVDTDPAVYAKLAALDAHLLSSAGYWLNDHTVGPKVSQSSPAIDLGDEASSYANEPNPNGGRVNLGAYGNTSEASKSAVGQPEISSFTLTALDGVPRVRAALTTGISVGEGYVATVEFFCTSNDVAACSATYENVGNGQTIDWLVPVVFDKDVSVTVVCTVTAKSAAAREASRTATVTVARPAGTYAGGGDRVVHVRPGADCKSDGRNWTDAYPDLRAALEAVAGDATKDEIWLAATNYDLQIEFAPTHPLAIRGGFKGGECRPSDRAADAVTVLKNNPAISTCFTMVNGAEAPVTFDRVSFANSSVRALYKTGAGDLTLTDCRFVGNGCYKEFSNAVGGRAFAATGAAEARLVVSNCVFEGQRVSDKDSAGSVRQGVDMGWGGAVYVSTFARATFDDCAFITNGIPLGEPNRTYQWCWGSDSKGAALYAVDAPVTVRNCRFVANSVGVSSPTDGSVCRLDGACGGSAFTNCLWLGNNERYSDRGTQNNTCGGAMSVALSAAEDKVDFQNCTFAYNVTSAAQSAGGLNVSVGDVTVRDSLFFGNLRASSNTTVTAGSDLSVQADGAVRLDYCGVTGFGTNTLSCVTADTLTLGTGVKAMDPLFVTTSNEWFSAVSWTAAGFPYYAKSSTIFATLASFNAHLRGGRGYVDETTGVLVRDYRREGPSPALDAGDPKSDRSREPSIPGIGDSGRRVNLGFYGNTPWATLSSPKGMFLIVR